MDVSAHWRAVERSEGKEEGSDFAEPSVEGPVGRLPETALSKTSLRESFGAFQNAGPHLGFRPRVCNCFSITPKALRQRQRLCRYLPGQAVWVRGDSIRP